ncbi:MAG: hypothetical protein IAF38_15780 [Bacteroidia bacterium]|nr:hypothetical protein [Bacteroidia bacterium]
MGNKMLLAAEKKGNPLLGILLLVVAVILLIITGPLGVIFGLLNGLVSRGLHGIGDFCYKVTVAIDHLGNVIMQELFNLLWIKRNGYKFGDPKETISSVLGKNLETETLKPFGILMARMLEHFERGHLQNSIDRNLARINKLNEDPAPAEMSNLTL